MCIYIFFEVIFFFDCCRVYESRNRAGNLAGPQDSNRAKLVPYSFFFLLFLLPLTQLHNIMRTGTHTHNHWNVKDKVDCLTLHLIHLFNYLPGIFFLFLFTVWLCSTCHSRGKQIIFLSKFICSFVAIQIYTYL